MVLSRTLPQGPRQGPIPTNAKDKHKEFTSVIKDLQDKDKG